MTGMKEILFSFIVALATLGTYAYFKHEISRPAREQKDANPTQVNLPESEARVQLNWGLEAIHLPHSLSPAERKITVAIIDTGCDIHHPELADLIWRNPGESGLDEYGQPRASNGIDDDDNGFVDDVYGWNFADDTPGIMDDHGHGTHIAGIIGATGDYGRPPKGPSPDVSLMILKYYDAEAHGADNLQNTIRAIRYAVRMGAQIINYSGGGLMRSQEEEEALRWAAAQGVLVVAAAGNEGLNSDFFHFYPADYELPNVLSVGAMDREGRLMSLSNFGLSTVDLVAPGRNIFSTLPGGTYGYMSGTSQATAFATGVAALLMTRSGQMTDPFTLIEHLRDNGHRDFQLKSRIRSGSALDAALALNALNVRVATTRTPAQRSE